MDPRKNRRDRARRRRSHRRWERRGPYPYITLTIDRTDAVRMRLAGYDPDNPWAVAMFHFNAVLAAADARGAAFSHAFDQFAAAATLKETLKEI